MKIKILNSVIIMSVLVIAFSLGIFKSLVLDSGSQYNIRNEGFKTTMQNEQKYNSLDPLLVFDGKISNYFEDESMNVSGMPFKFYQFDVKKKAEKIMEWYINTWTKKELVAIVNKNETGGNIEAIDWKNGQFLNTFIHYDKKHKITKVIATSLLFKVNNKIVDLKKYNNMNNPSFLIEGRNPFGGKWESNIFERRGDLIKIVEDVLNQKVKEGWKVIEKNIDNPYAIISMDNKFNNKSMLFFKENLSTGITAIQELRINETI
ncbi:MAG: hypothetical protein ACD_79C01026G0003 [uncultured bacterium]|nr:MAG: hypothetical protein ACD_79C01026G0003 [uncultured bacterium]